MQGKPPANGPRRIVRRRPTAARRRTHRGVMLVYLLIVVSLSFLRPSTSWGLGLLTLVGLIAFLLYRWFALARRLREIKVVDGRYCARCNYDLTGNVSGTCPECGSHFGKPTRSMRYRM